MRDVKGNSFAMELLKIGAIGVIDEDKFMNLFPVNT